MKNSFLFRVLIIVSAICFQKPSDLMAQNWLTTGNAGTTSSNYIGTSDLQDFYLGTAGINRVKIFGTGSNPGTFKLLGANTYFTFGGTGGGAINWPANTSLSFRTLTNTDDNSSYTTRLFIAADGKLGVKYASPGVTIDAREDNGAIGIGGATGTAPPQMYLAVASTDGSYGLSKNNTILYSQRNYKFYINAGGFYNSTRADLVFTSGFNNTRTNMTIYGETGQVGIGTNCASTDALLAVNGKIYATALQLKLPNASGCFPDYVFAPEYKLASLEEVEKYIQKNKHLSGIQSAEEVEKEGVNVMDLNTKMLEKIEELTLYMIELKKENEIFKKENNEIKEKLNVLLEESCH